jgi:hypothetical protein
MKARAERRNHVDITPGLAFIFSKDPNPSPRWEDLDDGELDGVWLVIQKRWVQKMDGGFYEYLCIAPAGYDGPTLEWMSVANTWIIRVADPAFPEFGR